MMTDPNNSLFDTIELLVENAISIELISLEYYVENTANFSLNSNVFESIELIPIGVGIEVVPITSTAEEI